MSGAPTPPAQAARTDAPPRVLVITPEDAVDRCSKYDSAGLREAYARYLVAEGRITEEVAQNLLKQQRFRDSANFDVVVPAFLEQDDPDLASTASATDAVAELRVGQVQEDQGGQTAEHEHAKPPKELRKFMAQLSDEQAKAGSSRSAGAAATAKGTMPCVREIATEELVCLHKPFDVRLDVPTSPPERACRRFPEEITCADWFLAKANRGAGAPEEEEQESTSQTSQTAVPRAPRAHARARRAAGVRFCNQLDAATSGIMLMAKTKRAAAVAAAFFQTRSVVKEYDCVVRGWVGVGSRSETADSDVVPQLEEGASGAEVVIDAPIGDIAVGSFARRCYGDKELADPRALKIQQARTGYRIVRRGYFVDSECKEDSSPSREKCSLVRCRIYTGRRHQIRVHMHHIGHGILGDTVYNDENLCAVHRNLEAKKGGALEEVEGSSAGPAPKRLKLKDDEDACAESAGGGGAGGGGTEPAGKNAATEIDPYTLRPKNELGSGRSSATFRMFLHSAFLHFPSLRLKYRCESGFDSYVSSES